MEKADEALQHSGKQVPERSHQSGIDLNVLLISHEIDPSQVLVMRHRPFEPELQKVLPWLAAEKPDRFNAYQQSQGPKVERAMQQAGFVASFIGHERGRRSLLVSTPSLALLQ